MALVAGNNLSACAGTMISSKIIKRRYGISIAVIGYLLGLFTEGFFIRNSIYTSMPVIGTTYVIIAIITALFIFIISNFLKLPQSLAMTLTSSAIGISVAIGYYVKWSFVFNMMLLWILAPVISILLMFVIMKIMESTVSKKHIWRTLNQFKIIVILSSLLMAFVLGANTIGLVYSTIPNTLIDQILATAAIIIGGFFLSTNTINKIGTEIIPIRYLNAASSQLAASTMIEFATVMGLPLSGTEVLTSSIYGAGVTYKNKIISKKIFSKIVYGWIMMIFIGFLVAYLLALLFI
jgi:PiT family inorganic phosphate transporter